MKSMTEHAKGAEGERGHKRQEVGENEDEGRKVQRSDEKEIKEMRW